MTAATALRLDREDEIRLPKGYELVDGVLKDKPVSWESDWISGELHALLRNYCREHRAGWATVETAYRCFPDRPKLIRKPDASFVARGRFPGETFPRGDARIAPDLAVEVVSPNDEAEELESKVTEYLGAGVRLVWVVYPKTRTAYVYRPDGTAARLTQDQQLSGESVLPGFSLRVGDVFPPAEEAPAPPAASE